MSGRCIAVISLPFRVAPAPVEQWASGKDLPARKIGVPLQKNNNFTSLMAGINYANPPEASYTVPNSGKLNQILLAHNNYVMRSPNLTTRSGHRVQTRGS